MDILKTTIKTSNKTKKRLLKLRKRRTECFDDIINRIIDEHNEYETNNIKG